MMGRRSCKQHNLDSDNNFWCTSGPTHCCSILRLFNMHNTLRKFFSNKYYVLLSGLVFFLFLWRLLNKNDGFRKIDSLHQIAENFSFHINFSTVFSKAKPPWSLPNITIGAVICSQDGNAVPRQEAVIMLKSVLISAQLHNVSQVVFHLFLEHKADRDFLVEKIKQWGNPFHNMQVDLYIHSAIAAVPEKYRSHMAYDHDFRCGYVRIFLSSQLPNVDEILYLDTDMIVTGSIVEIWNNFDRMTGEQLVGVARNNEASNPHWMNVYQEWFADIPHPRPKGLNSGLLLMNLTRMRDYNWEEKILRLFDDYSRIFKMNDQRLLNSLLYFDQGILQILSCKFNFRFTHCERGLYCTDAEKDPQGIHIIHGAANYFDSTKTFYQIFHAYQQFNFQSCNFIPKIVIEDLMLPLKKAFTTNSSFKLNIGSRFKPVYSQCFGILDKLLFKDLIFV